MLSPWIKSLATIGFVVWGSSQATAQSASTQHASTQYASTQYGSMAFYGADAGVTSGHPISASAFYNQTGHFSHSGLPRSPGAGVGILNGMGRYWGIGFSEGYHTCPTGSCASGSCKTGLCAIGGGGALRFSAPNIVAPTAPACQPCQATSPNNNCGMRGFGNYQYHPGHVFGKPSYGNPHYPTHSIDWQEAVKYDQGPCVPNSVYQQHGPLPASPNYEYSTPTPLPHGPLPTTQPIGRQPLAPRSPGLPESLPELSPSDAAPQAWPWQRGQGGIAPQVAAPQVAAPQVAAPQVAAPQVAAPQVPAPPVNRNEPTLPAPRPIVPQSRAPGQDLAPEDEELLDSAGSETQLQVPAKVEAVQPPVVPAPPATTAPDSKAPAVMPAPAPAAADDEDLLSQRRAPIRQPKRR